MLEQRNVATRISARDLNHARKFYSEKPGVESFEERPKCLRYRPGNGFFVLLESIRKALGTHTLRDREVPKQAVDTTGSCAHLLSVA